MKSDEDPALRPGMLNQAPTIVVVMAAYFALSGLVLQVAPRGPALVFLHQYGFSPHRILEAITGQPSGFAALGTLFSSALLHGGFVHAFFNAGFFLAFGAPVARALQGGDGVVAGAVRFLAFFFCCAAAGSLAHFATDPDSHRVAVGASGAIFGLFGAVARMGLGSVRTNRLGGLALLPLTSKPVGQAVFMVIALHAFMMIIPGAFTMNLGPGVEIGIVAHIGGFVAGLLGFPAFVPKR